MAKLHYLNAKALNSLSCKSLHQLGQFFAKTSSSFNLAACPQLETCVVNKRLVPEDENVRFLYEAYKTNFLDQLDNLTIASKSDMEVILLSDYLYQAFTNDNYLSRLEQIASNIPRRAADDLEFAVRVLLSADGPKLLSVASMLETFNDSLCYHYFIRDYDTLRFYQKPILMPGNELDAALSSHLSLELQKEYGTKVCTIKSEVKDALWIIVITHGGVRQKEKNESQAEAVDMVRQPIETDCIIYDTKYDDLRIHMQKHRIKTMNIYYKALGKVLFQNANWWKPGDKYGLHRFNLPKEELQQLLARGAERLSNPTSGKLSLNISSVHYSETISLEGKRRTTNKHGISNREGINHSLADGQTLVPLHATITSITLRFSNRLNNKEKSVPITLGGKKRTLESEFVPDLEDWLHEEGICAAIHDITPEAAS